MSSQLTRRGFLRLVSAASLTPWLTGPQSVVRAPAERREDAHAPNVLIIVFDALSATNMSTYGYPRETTPNIDRFAERATVYHHHYASGNYTTPGTASLLTGVYPWSHRLFHHTGTMTRELADRNLFRVLADRGYQTIAYTHNVWTDLLLNQCSGICDHIDPGRFCLLDGLFHDRAFPGDEHVAYRGFEDLALQPFHMPSSLFLSLADIMRFSVAEKVINRRYAKLYPRGVPAFFKLFYLLDDAMDGIGHIAQGASRPFLGYFHLMPPHGPYCARREFVGRFEDGWAPPSKKASPFTQGHSEEYLNRNRQEYDEFVANVDAEFGRLFESLEAAGLLDDTYVVVTSDHGELFERGILAHDTPVLYEPLIHVPLLIWKPGQRDREDVHEPTSVVDLLPTVLRAAGGPVPRWCEGRVLPTAGSEAESDGRAVYAVEAKHNPRQAPLTQASIALIRGRYKLTRYAGYRNAEDVDELYDLTEDPEELENIYSTNATVAADLREELEEKLRAVNAPYV